MSQKEWSDISEHAFSNDNECIYYINLTSYDGKKNRIIFGSILKYAKQKDGKKRTSIFKLAVWPNR